MAGEKRILEYLGEVDLDGQDGATVNSSTLKDCKVVGLYFSAHWCPPCKGFTPVLKKKYEAIKKDAGLEIVFLSSDRDAGAAKSYFGEMPWLMVPFENRTLKEKVSGQFGINGIPSLVLIYNDGTVSKNGRGIFSLESDEEIKEALLKKEAS